MSFQDLEAGKPLKSQRNSINVKKDSTPAMASGIFQINTAVSIFQRLVNTLGTAKDTPDLRDKLLEDRLPDSPFDESAADTNGMFLQRGTSGGGRIEGSLGERSGYASRKNREDHGYCREKMHT